LRGLTLNFNYAVYTQEDWVKHRDSNRFFSNLGSIFKSGFVRQLGNEVGFVTAVAAFVVLWNCIAVAGYCDFSG